MINCWPAVRVGAAGNNLFVDVTYHWWLGEGLALLVNVDAVGRMGLHLAAGRRTVRPAARAAARELVRHWSE